MKVHKQIVSTKDIDIQICDITLLSAEEYMVAKENIPPVNEWWWLRSPGFFQCNAAIINSSGALVGRNVNGDYACIRPALKISNNLKILDKIEFAKHVGTVVFIKDNYCYVLCDDVVKRTFFRSDWVAKDANVYEASDIKTSLEAWAKENGIVYERQ